MNTGTIDSPKALTQQKRTEKLIFVVMLFAWNFVLNEILCAKQFPISVELFVQIFIKNTQKILWNSQWTFHVNIFGS